MTAASPRYPGALTDVAGLEVGHHQEAARATGCTVVLARAGAVAGVDVRGAAPGTRETDLLAPVNLVDKVHAVLLSGGSAFGLDAASGVMRWLDERGLGFDVGVARVPIVPAAVLFDLHVGDARVRPNATSGYAACVAASSAPPAQGCVGAGAGATVGKLWGISHAMKSGIGSSSLRLHGVTVAALIACNAVGDVLDPSTAQVLAGARRADGTGLRNTHHSLLAGQTPAFALAGGNTTIGVIATDAPLNKTQATKLAQIAHDGLARCISPVHTQLDGDTLFTLATGRAAQAPDLVSLGAAVVEVTQRATLNAVYAAQGLDTPTGRLPALAELI